MDKGLIAGIYDNIDLAIKESDATGRFISRFTKHVLDSCPDVLIDFIDSYPSLIGDDITGVDRAIELDVASDMFIDLDYALDEAMKDGKDYLPLVHRAEEMAEQIYKALGESRRSRTSLMDIKEMLDPERYNKQYPEIQQMRVRLQNTRDDLKD